MYRLFDWQCQRCKARNEHLNKVPAGEDSPSSAVLWCPTCATDTPHDRLMSAPARYCGEDYHNPKMRGSRFDTLGHEAMPRLPPTPGMREHTAKINAIGRSLPDDIVGSDRRIEASRKAGKGPDISDIMSHHNKPEVREVKEARAQVRARNKRKRERVAALSAPGNTVNMRRDKCAGDPKI